jgi:predicted AAA+ superfamily ATPase
MAQKYITRSLEPVIKKAACSFPAVILLGPRQSGKTTLLKHLFGSTYNYVSLDPPDVRESAITNPRGFLKKYSPPVIFDEVQQTPNLLPYIKEHIDQHRDQAGQFLISGSQNLLLLQSVTETLAGRTAILKLLPLSLREVCGKPQKPFYWETPKADPGESKFAFSTLWGKFLSGFYPELSVNPGLDFHLWHQGYLQTYIERDVRTLRQIGDLTQFQIFMRTLAARSGQLLNLANVTSDIGITINTAKAWLSIMEATFQIVILRPYFANIGKRLVKTPKIYFTDVGMLCHVLGLRDPEHAASGPSGGAIIETAVLMEIIKTITHRGDDPRIHFWRTAKGAEIDIIVDTGRDLIPIEVKLSATPRPGMADWIEAFQTDLGKKAAHGYVVHSGDVHLPLKPKVTAIPFSSL